MREIAESVLSWTAYAERELSISELQAALAVKPSDTELDNENLLEPEEMINYCAGLVTIDEKSQVVRLIHYTTRDYLRGAKCLPNAQKKIATACLTYLLFEANAKPLESREAYLQFLVKNVLFDYAAKYLGNHIGEELDGSTEALVMDFFSSRSQLLNFWLFVTGAARWRFPEHFQTSFVHGLHVCAWFGLVSLSRSLLQSFQRDKTTTADVRDFFGNTPLSYAASRGHGALVRYLADRDDIDADSKDEYGVTPLSIAAKRGHKDIVRYLADRDDVDADSKDKYGVTPLSKTAKRGHKDIVRYLADRDDVDADSKDEDKRTPLSKAAKRGHKDVVRYLADSDDVDKESKIGALVGAAACGKWDTVKLLTELADMAKELEAIAMNKDMVQAVTWGAFNVVICLAQRDDVSLESKGQAIVRAAEMGCSDITNYLATRDDISVEYKWEALKRAERNASYYTSYKLAWYREASQEIVECIRNLCGDPPPT